MKLNRISLAIALALGVCALCVGSANAAVNAYLCINNPDCVSAVPEPNTWAMMLVGFVGLGGLLRRRRVKPALQG